MSVKVPDRKTSSMEFYQNAERIADELSSLIIREFGIKKKIRNIELYDKNNILTEEEKDIINSILESHNIDINNINLELKIPKIFIERDQIYFYIKTQELLDNVINGNETFPNNSIDYLFRKSYFKSGIATCKTIKNHLMRMIRLYKLKINSFKKIIDLLDNEIKLLRGVIESDKKRFAIYELAIDEFYKEFREDFTKSMYKEIENKCIDYYIKSDKINL